MRSRIILCAAALAALAACSDAGAPTVTDPRRGVPSHPSIDSLISGTRRADSIPVVDRIAGLLTRNFSRVVLPADAFSRSADAVHPDVACDQRGWNGARCWLMYTPYLGSEPSFENPGILQAANDTAWQTPPSITNPIVGWPGMGAYNSDPDHAFDPADGRLVQVYRLVADDTNKIMIMSTTNAKTWTTARVAFKERNHDAVSPSLVIDRNRNASLWYVRTGTDGCMTRTSTVQRRTATPGATQRLDLATWSAPVAADLVIPNYVIWHLDVTQLPGGNGYLALVVAYPRGRSCGASDLWLATSADGIQWTTPAAPLMWRAMKVAVSRSISTWYRGTLRYDAATDSLHVWPSALAGTTWTIYHSAYKLDELLSLLASAQPSDFKPAFSAAPVAGPQVQMP